MQTSLSVSTFRTAGLVFALIGLTVAGSGTTPAKEVTGSNCNATLVARGKYLVEGVALCGRCHTPVDDTGEPDRARWLMGAPVELRSTVPVRDWAIVAPRLAGLPPGTDAEFMMLLMTGVSRTGRPPQPPMPRFQMTHADAEAVLAYLKSLKARPEPIH